jgi:hypothetical protein
MAVATGRPPYRAYVAITATFALNDFLQAGFVVLSSKANELEKRAG